MNCAIEHCRSWLQGRAKVSFVPSIANSLCHSFPGNCSFASGSAHLLLAEDESLSTSRSRSSARPPVFLPRSLSLCTLLMCSSFLRKPSNDDRCILGCVSLRVRIGHVISRTLVQCQSAMVSARGPNQLSIGSVVGPGGPRLQACTFPSTPVFHIDGQLLTVRCTMSGGTSTAATAPAAATIPMALRALFSR